MIFINCTVKESVGLFSPFFPVSIPYGIAYLMAMLKSENLSFDYIDQQVDENTSKLIDEYSKKYTKKIFCISFLTEAYRSVKDVGRYIKNNYPDSIIVLGGIHVSAMPEECLDLDFVDYIFVGEAESAIAEIYRRLMADKDIRDILGVGFTTGSDYQINKPSDIIIDLDKIPIIPYELFANKRKYSLGYITTSRGCPYNCIFCNNNLTGHRVCRYKSVDNVIKELEILICQYKQKDITFFDDNFLSSPKRVKELCNKIIERELHKKCVFMFQSRAKDIKVDIIEHLSKAGFQTVFIGIESVSTHLLSIMGKKEQIIDIEKAIKIAKSARFKVIANFLFCLPEETTHDREDCVNFAIKNKIDVAKFNNIVPYPGTELYNQNYQRKINFKHPDYGNFNSQIAIIHPFYKKIPFPLIPNNSTNKQIESEIIMSYLKFYFRFSVIKKILTQKKWGSLIFQFGNKNSDVIRNIPSILILAANLSIKVLKAFIYFIFSKRNA